MPAYVSETIIWAFVVAFIVCLIGGVLMIFGFWEPKDPAVKKWLFSGVVISVVGAVVGFGVQQFRTPPQKEPDDRPHVTAPDRPAEPGRMVQPPDRNEVREGEGEPEPEPTPEQPVPDFVTPAIPDDLKDWATAELGPRPVLQPGASENYPSCVARLKAQAPAAISSEDARACRRDLQQVHMDVIVSYYQTKSPYDRNLEDQEAALRRSGLQSDELPKYNYIIAEMERLNGSDSSEASAVHSLENRLLKDIEKCRRSRCS